MTQNSAKIEKCKSIIEVLKSLMLTFLLALFGLLSYGFINLDMLNIAKTAIVFLTALAVGLVCALCGLLILKQTKILGEL